MTRILNRLVLALLVLIGTGVVLAPAAGADGVGPSNFESVIDSVEPSVPGVQVEVVGGDSFLQVTADPGTTVEIPGYDGEPYLRIEPDGTVLENQRSAAAYLNVRRNGDVSRMPSDVSSEAEPEWKTIGTGGEVAWHDHRIHWMTSEAPEIAADGVVQPWVVDLTVDGTAVVVEGRLLHHENIFPWAALVAAAVAVTAAWVCRRSAVRLPLLLGVSVVAFGLSVATYVLNPPGAQASVLPLILPALSALAAMVALVLTKLSPTLRNLVLPLVSIAALAGWAVTRLGVWWMPMNPTALPGWLDRVGTALVVGVIVGVAVAILLRPLPAPTPESA